MSINGPMVHHLSRSLVLALAACVVGGATCKPKPPVIKPPLDTGDIEAVADPSPVVEDHEPEAEQEELQLAKADPAAVPDATDHAAVGRPDSGTKNKGSVAFEAKGDEFAEY